MSMLSYLGRLKLTYAVYNLFRPGLLQHNVPEYGGMGSGNGTFPPFLVSIFNGFLQPKPHGKSEINEGAI